MNDIDLQSRSLKASPIASDKQKLELELAANKAIGDVLKIISRSPIVLEDVFDALLSNVARLCDSELGGLFLHNPDGTFRIGYVKGMSKEFEDYLIKQENFEAAPNTGLGFVARKKKLLHIEDVVDHDTYRGGDPLRIAAVELAGVRTFVAIPLLAGDNLIGVFTIYRQEVRPFNEEHLRLAERFADQAVIAIENARLLKETEDLSNSLAEMNRTLETKVQQQVEELEKHSRLTRFLPDKIAEVILKSGDDSILSSHRRMIATVFCDLRRFTSFSESAEPEEVMQILEAFHAETTELTAKWGGTIVMRAGDGIMIVLNDPVPIDNPAESAVGMAADFRTALSALCEKWRKYEYDLGFGVGISYGYATLGVVGTESQQNYTAIGAAVNIASRLCDNAADGEILVTQRVCTEAEDKYSFESGGPLELKGVSRPMNVFKLT